MKTKKQLKAEIAENKKKIVDLTEEIKDLKDTDDLDALKAENEKLEQAITKAQAEKKKLADDAEFEELSEEEKKAKIKKDEKQVQDAMDFIKGL